MNDNHDNTNADNPAVQAPEFRLQVLGAYEWHIITRDGAHVATITDTTMAIADRIVSALNQYRPRSGRTS